MECFSLSFLQLEVFTALGPTLTHLIKLSHTVMQLSDLYHRVLVAACEVGDDKLGTPSGSICVRGHKVLFHSATSIISFSRSAATESWVGRPSEIIGLGVTFLGCIGLVYLIRLWRIFGAALVRDLFCLQQILT